MAAVTANQLVERQVGDRASHLVAASTNIYGGTLVFINAAGNADDDIAAGLNKFAGVAIGQSDNSAGLVGATRVEVWRKGVFKLVGSAFTLASVGVAVFATDNYTITVTATSNVRVGTIVEFISATLVRVAIDEDTV